MGMMVGFKAAFFAVAMVNDIYGGDFSVFIDKIVVICNVIVARAVDKNSFYGLIGRRCARSSSLVWRYNVLTSLLCKRWLVDVLPCLVVCHIWLGN